VVCSVKGCWRLCLALVVEQLTRVELPHLSARPASCPVTAAANHKWSCQCKQARPYAHTVSRSACHVDLRKLCSNHPPFVACACVCACARCVHRSPRMCHAAASVLLFARCIEADSAACVGPQGPHAEHPHPWLRVHVCIMLPLHVQDPKDAMLREFQDEIKRLKILLEVCASKCPCAHMCMCVHLQVPLAVRLYVSPYVWLQCDWIVWLYVSPYVWLHCDRIVWLYVSPYVWLHCDRIVWLYVSPYVRLQCDQTVCLFVVPFA